MMVNCSSLKFLIRYLIGHSLYSSPVFNFLFILNLICGQIHLAFKPGNFNQFHPFSVSLINKY